VDTQVFKSKNTLGVAPEDQILAHEKNRAHFPYLQTGSARNRVPFASEHGIVNHRVNLKFFAGTAPKFLERSNGLASAEIAEGVPTIALG
jgi:hypothetical protein